MADRTTIEWTDASWNPVTGCTKVSAGCKYCYAERVTERFGRQKFTDIVLHPERLDQPLRWKRPRRIFVNSMSDLFHERIPQTFIADVFEVMFQAEHHVFQVLTKRPERMQVMMASWDKLFAPARNIWLGVSVENQEQADKRIPLLLQTPAAVRFLSVEPLLGPVDLRRWLPTKVCQHCSGDAGLDFQVRQDCRKEGFNVSGSMEFPDRYGFPSVPFDALAVPPDSTPNDLLQPSDNASVGAVDSNLGAVGSVGMPSPLHVPFAVKQASKITEVNAVTRYPDVLAKQDAATLAPARDSGIPDSSPDRRFSNAVSLGDPAKRLSSEIRSDDLPSCPCSCHSRHVPHCTIDWCIVGGESGGPPERALVREIGFRPGSGRIFEEKPEALQWIYLLRDQCIAAGVPFFFKQWGGPTPKSGGRLLDGRTWDEYPS